MGNFFVNLGKGFIRSAVNQVGRDGGKVISNNLYGNAHSTPIRNICINSTNQYFDEITNEIVSPNELRERAGAEGFKPVVFRNKTIVKIICYILILPFSFLFLPAIGLFIWGIRRLTKKYVYMKKTVTTANYVTDRRYKTGRRLNGYSNEDIAIKVPANSYERSALMKAGLIYIALSLFSFYIGKISWNYINESNKEYEYTKFIEQADQEKERIEWWKSIDSIKYKEKMDEFNLKYQKAIKYTEEHKQ